MRVVRREENVRHSEAGAEQTHNLFNPSQDELSAAVVLTAAADFHHVRLVGFFAVLAAVFAVLFRRAIAGTVPAFV